MNRAASIPDFTNSELWVVRDTLKQRYGEPVDPQFAETEMRLDPNSTVLTSCPALFWQHKDTNFIIAKLGDRRYHAQFFYRIHQHYSTGVQEYDDLTECVVTLLQVQADRELTRSQEEE